MENQKPTNELLTKVADEQRKKLFSRNEYNNEDGYGREHPNALFEGGNDQQGRGASESGKVGNAKDIELRKGMLKINRYGNGNGYGPGHSDTIFEGGDDMYGRSPQEEGNVGNARDVKNRDDNKKRNTFSESNRYPNF